MRFLGRMGVLCGVGVVCAVVANRVLPWRIAWMAEPNGSVLAEAGRAEVGSIDVAELQRLLASEDVIVIDARSAELFADGHIPGAINVPGMVVHREGEVLAAILPPPDEPARPMVAIYCQGADCLDSLRVYEYLQRLGYGPRLRILRGGWPAWRGAGLAVERGGL